jgi:23S rRNA (guanosine2251-2'-O)-methyltransferase
MIQFPSRLREGLGVGKVRFGTLRLASASALRDGPAMRRKARQVSNPANRPRFWGRHAIAAAVANPGRAIVRIWATREAAAALDLPAHVPVTYADAADLGRMVPRDAPHQGVVAEVEPLADVWLADVLDGAEEGRPLLVLDQVTDPHNVGAIFRSAAAFDTLAVVTQDRHAPPESGALAKAASGALESVPWVRVVNLARALEEIAGAGFWRIGLAGEAETTLAEALGPPRVALVLGAEGEGLRHNVAQHCDALARLPISDRMESLNVSNAAAIALYAAAAARQRA